MLGLGLAQNLWKLSSLLALCGKEETMEQMQFFIWSHILRNCSLGVVIIKWRLALLHTTSDDQFLFLFSYVPMYNGFQ